MRVTGGTLKNRKLIVPKGNAIRPTTDKVRQAIFNILNQYDLPANVPVIDAFCGTGALGLEAVSREANSCLFLDKNRESLAVCRRNIDDLGVVDRASLLQKDVLKPGKRPSRFKPADLLFLDPPYRLNLIPPALLALAENGWISFGALCVLECEKEAATELPDGFMLRDQRLYGDTKIIYCHYKSAIIEQFL